MTRRLKLKDGRIVAYAGTSPQYVKGTPLKSNVRKFDITEEEAKRLAKGGQSSNKSNKGGDQ